MIEATAALLAFLSLACFTLAIGGWVIDRIDPFGERADARRRNDQARRIR